MKCDPIKSIDDVRAVRDMLLATATPREAALWTFGVNSALRISDILALRVDQLTNEGIRIKEIKTGKWRTMKLNKPALEACLVSVAWLNTKGIQPEYVFQGLQRPAPITRQHAWNQIKYAAHRCGLAGNFGTHTMRKTFGYHLYSNGVRLAEIMMILNQSSEKVTELYIGVNQEQLDKTFEDYAIAL